MMALTTPVSPTANLATYPEVWNLPISRPSNTPWDSLSQRTTQLWMYRCFRYTFERPQRLWLSRQGRGHRTYVVRNVAGPCLDGLYPILFMSAVHPCTVSVRPLVMPTRPHTRPHWPVEKITGNIKTFTKW